MNDTFTSREVVEITGVRYRTLDNWARTGFLIPSLQVAHGSGTDRRYIFEDLIRVKAVRLLRANGMQLQALVPVVRCLQTYEIGLGGWVAACGEEARFFLTGNGALRWLTKDSAFVTAIILNLTPLVKEIEQAKGAHA